MRIIIQVKFRDSKLVHPCNFCFQDQELLLTIKDVIEWFSRSQNLDRDSILSCFGLCKSIKSMNFLPLDYPIISLVKKSIWRQSFNITLYLAFWRIPSKWDIHTGLCDEKANYMLFLDLRQRYLDQKLKNLNSNHFRELDKQIKILASLSGLLRLADIWQKSTEENSNTSITGNSSIKRYIPYSYYSLLTEQQWRKYMNEREKSWNDNEKLQNVDLCPNPPQWIIVQWITLLMTIMPFSFWSTNFRVKYLQLTGMTPEKECMIRSTRYKLDLCISVDGIRIEWPEKESKKEGKSMAKSNDSDKRNVLEEFCGNAETIYIPFGWIQSIKLLTMPAVISRSDISSSQVFINDDDLFSSNSNIMQPVNTQISNIGLSPIFPSTSQSILFNDVSGYKSSINSTVTSMLLESNSSSSIVYIRLATGIRNARKSLSSLVLVKMLRKDLCMFQSQYEYNKELRYAFCIGDYFKKMIKYYPRQFMNQILLDCEWQSSVSEYEAFDVNQTSILPIRVQCKMLSFDELKSNQECQVWAMNSYNSCDGLLIAICEQNKLTRERLLFGLKHNNRWLDMKLSLLGQGYHFLRDIVTFRMKWLVPIPEKIIDTDQLNLSFIDASFCYILHAISGASLSIDRQTFINLSVSCMRISMQHQSFEIKFPSILELGQFMKNRCPLWQWLKRAKCSADQEQLVLKEIHQLYTIQISQNDLLLEKIRLINLFEKKLSFIYFSWQPNYHRIGISPFGWILQRRGKIIRHARYSYDAYNGMPNWKCVCNGFHLQLSEMKSVSEHSKKTGKIESRMLLNDSYSMFALHSLQIALLVQESFQLSKYIINQSGSSISNSNLDIERRVSITEQSNNEMIERTSQCSLLMTSLSSSCYDIPKLSPSSLSELQLPMSSYPLKIKPCDISPVIDALAHQCENSLKIGDADKIDTYKIENNDSLRGLDHVYDNDTSILENHNNASENQEHSHSYNYKKETFSSEMSFKNLLGIIQRKNDVRIHDMNTKISEKSVQLREEFIISSDPYSQVLTLNVNGKNNRFIHYNITQDDELDLTIFQNILHISSDDSLIHGTILSDACVIPSSHMNLKEQTRIISSCHSRSQIINVTETNEFRSTSQDSLSISNESIIESSENICVSECVDHIVNTFEPEILSFSLPDIE